MPTCLDDLNETLTDIAQSVALLNTPPAWSWDDSPGLGLAQGGALFPSGNQYMGRSEDQSLVVCEASLTPTVNGTSSNELVLSGLLEAQYSGAPIGIAQIFAGGVAHVCAVIWFDDGLARFYTQGNGSQFGVTPTTAVLTSSTVLLWLRYRSGE